VESCDAALPGRQPGVDDILVSPRWLQLAEVRGLLLNLGRVIADQVCVLVELIRARGLPEVLELLNERRILLLKVPADRVGFPDELGFGWRLMRRAGR
jgi:hypothetical protein